MGWGEYLTEVRDDDEVLGSSEDEDEYIQRIENPGQEGSESEVDDHTHGPRTITEKRRAQNAIFKAFAEHQTEEATKTEIHEATAGTKDVELSIRDILAKQENSARITNPRDYQTELFQKAKDENIIAVLDTGSGKTHIATLLLRHILDVELDSRAKGNPHKTAFFLVDSVNLVFQQSNVLRCGLDQNVDGICGAMGASLWQKPTWDKHFTKNMVIVCTAEVLVQCLMHSFITIPMINLLIFDEAHHAKSNHPYARLIKDYYLHEPDISKRPRIFGMTASPVDANVDVRQAARDLETLLHCKIATTSDLALLANHITRPTEDVLIYPRLRESFETSLHQELKSRYGHIKAFHKFFEASKLFSSELGRWASDVYWSFAFSEDVSRKLQLREERVFHKQQTSQPIEKLDQEIAQLREAAEYLRYYDFGSPSPILEDLSAKVLLLYRWLRFGYYARTGEARCMVFVERRQTARLLNMIFMHIGGQHLRSDVLIGSTSRFGDLNVSLKSQVMTVAKFRRGEINCIFSTSVAEEGLDIPQCNLVVRFDLYRTMIAYVQSRGRARHRNSKYIHMVEQDNTDHKDAVYNAKNAEKVMRDFCNGLSSDRFLNEVDDTTIRALEDEQSFRTYTDTESGAKLTYRSSLSVLAHFVACLPGATQDVCLQPSYVIDRQGGRFICEVVLPDCSPVISMKGQPYRKKAIAKYSAAFEMCLELRKKDFLDKTLLPTYTRQLPSMRNAMLAISAKKKDLYPMRIKPEFWQLGYETIPELLYLTVIDVGGGLERPHQPIGLITRAGFPQMPKFPIYLPDGQASQVVSFPLNTPLSATEEVLRLFTTLTLAIYKDIFAKVYEYDVAKLSYWILPLKPKMVESTIVFEKSRSEPSDLIDWDQIHEICEKDEYRWSPEMSNDFLADRYIVDPNDGGRRFYSVGVAPHLKATDPVPDLAPKYKYMKDILDYSISLWAKSRAKFEDTWDRSQPVVEVEKIPFRRNLLAHVEKDEDEVKWNPKAYVCPQPLKISALTTKFVAMCYVLPAIIHRFEAYMTAIDACNRLDLDIGPGLALEALTKDSDNSEEHGEEKINFRSGMGPNYERLEFMGDCFLKMATSLSTFVQQPDENEFECHVRRMCMLCNKNLMKAAQNYELYEYVRTMAFSRRTWYPDGLKQTKGKGMNQTGPKNIKHQLGDKTIADVCEAFIGAAFMQHNQTDCWDPTNWDQAVKAVKIFVDSDDHIMEKFADYYATYEKPKYQLADATASQLDLAQKIEQKHPYHFKYPRLLRSAFVHPSQAFMWEKIPNYQRLEFLGDALLDQVFIMHIFYRYPSKDPQWLTEHKMPMVSNKFLGAVCVALGFHTHIRQNSAALSAQIHNYVTDIEELEREAGGAVDYWANATTDPPKCLADVVEAYVAAIFVDSGFNFAVVQDFFDRHLQRFFVDMTIYDKWAKNNPITRLTGLLNESLGCKQWRLGTHPQKSVIPGVKERTLAMVQIHHKIWFHATAESARYAKPKVCHMAVEKLDGLPPFEFRKQYECDCIESAEGENGEAEMDLEGMVD